MALLARGSSKWKASTCRESRHQTKQASSSKQQHRVCMRQCWARQNTAAQRTPPPNKKKLGRRSVRATAEAVELAVVSTPTEPALRSRNYCTMPPQHLQRRERLSARAFAAWASCDDEDAPTELCFGARAAAVRCCPRMQLPNRLRPPGSAHPESGWRAVAGTPRNCCLRKPTNPASTAAAQDGLASPSPATQVPLSSPRYRRKLQPPGGVRLWNPRRPRPRRGFAAFASNRSTGRPPATPGLLLDVHRTCRVRTRGRRRPFGCRNGITSRGSSRHVLVRRPLHKR